MAVTALQTPKATDNGPDTGLAVLHLGKTFKTRPVLRDVSLSVQRGEAVGLLGPNGAGKTTSFYCVTGLISPDVGKIMLDGQDITLLPMYRRARLGIGYLPQEASIFRGMTVEGNIRAVGEIREMVSHLKDRGLGVLITDHNVRETLDIIDRAYILHEGSVLFEGRPSEIVAHEGVRRVYLGERFSL